jgi:hypothetical protein
MAEETLLDSEAMRHFTRIGPDGDSISDAPRC